MPSAPDPTAPAPESTKSVLSAFLVSLAIAAGKAAVLAACDETRRQLTKPCRPSRTKKPSLSKS
jgi:hypothetical protein